MKPIDESRDAHSDFAGDESTNVMGVDLLSSLTERSRRIDVASPTVPEPEISVVVDEVEPVTTVSPAKRPQLLVVDGEYPAIGDEESTVTMEEPEPTTVAIRSHRASPPPPAPEPLPAPAFVAQPVAAPAVAVAAPAVAVPAPAVAVPVPSVGDPQWAAELRPRPLPTVRVAPLPAPELETAPESTPKPAVGSRRLSVVAAVALGVAAWTVGLGHHELLPASAISSPAPSASRAVAAPQSVASARTESADPMRPRPRPVAPHRQRI